MTVTEIRSNIRLFAVDTSLYITEDNPNAAAKILNTDLNKISPGKVLVSEI